MMKEFLPTYLYIKQHSITGLLYFGKTTRADILLSEEYKGSGVYWKKHLTQHGKEHVVTLWYCLFPTKTELTEFALCCSKLWDIVKSTNDCGKKIWANEKYEDGLNGGFGPIWKNKKQSTEHKKKRSDKLCCIPRPVGVRQQISETRKQKMIDGTLGTVRGLRWNADQKNNLSNVAKSRPLITCLCCNKACTAGNFARWHGDNCKPRMRSTLKKIS